MLSDKIHETAELIRFPPKIGIEERVVTLATAPEHIVVAAELVCQVEHLSHLGGGKREHFGIGVRCSASGVPWMTEKVCRSPQQLDTGSLHRRREFIANRF